MPSGLTTDARHLVCNDDLVSKAGASSSKCGLVFETSSSTDEEDEDSQVPEGYAEVVWISHIDERRMHEPALEPLEELNVIDRAFVVGDSVARAENATGQSGIVTQLHVCLDVEIPGGLRLGNISTRCVQQIRDFIPGFYVLHNGWVGRIQDVADDVTVSLPRNAKVRILSAQPDLLRPSENATSFYDDEKPTYYPGMKVYVEAGVLADHAELLSGRLSHFGRTTGTVLSVEPGEIHVDWVAAIGSPQNANLHPPPEVVGPHGLKVLPYFKQICWRVGDHAMLSPELRRVGEEKLEQIAGKKLKRGESTGTLNQACLVTRTRTWADVRWQDGTVSQKMPTNHLVPVVRIGEHDFWPEDYVVEQELEGDAEEQASQHRRMGVVESVDFSARTARVKWLKKDREGEHIEPHSRADWYELETVPVYALSEHSDFSFRHGDVVVWLGELANGIEESAADVHGRVGEVVGVEDGLLDVLWPDLSKSKVSPFRVFVVSREEEEVAEQEAEEGEFEGSEASWETPHSQEAAAMHDSERAVQQYAMLRSREEEDQLASLGVLNDEGDMAENNLVTAPEVERDHLHQPDGNGHFSLSSTPGHAHGGSDQKEGEEEKVAASAAEQQQQEQTVVEGGMSEDVFAKCGERGFDMAEGTPKDHRMVNGEGGQFQDRAWQKAIRREWGILEKSLPDGVWARAYEERMDLMRAMMEGPSGTPYAGFALVFDVAFSPRFPKEPPRVEFDARGLCVNPNLYACGKVCLSLLNTWQGDATEQWRPNESSLLQVFVSLQGLVLISKPYYNEAGYDSHQGSDEGERNAALYNEQCFLTLIRLALSQLKRPPGDFSALLKAHYRRRRDFLLSRCEAYLAGTPVGSPLPGELNESVCPTPRQNASSEGFRLALERLLPRLRSALMAL